MIKGILIDFWNTLYVQIVDERSYQIERARRIARASGIEADENALRIFLEIRRKMDYRRRTELREVPAEVEIREFLNALGVKEEVSEKHLMGYSWPFINLTVMRCHAKSVLESLSRKYLLGIVSNCTYSPMIVEKLRRDGILPLFRAVLTSQDIGWIKPDRRIFLAALGQIGLRPEEAVMVGDSEKEDIEGAKAIGMKAILFGESRSGMADAAVKSWREIPTVLEMIP
jgi:putative hydrolase of the HAD superfamily